MKIDIRQILGITAGIISFIAYLIYIRSILRGESKPERTTWFIWTFMGLVLAVSYYFSGARNTIWSPIVEFVGPLIIALLSIKYGKGTLRDKTDLFCFWGAMVSIALWIIFKSPVLALTINLAIDAFALIPTIKKSLVHPREENFWAWFGTGIGDSMNLFAVERPLFSILVYPVWMLLQDLVIIAILFRAKIKRFGKPDKHIT